MCSECKLLKCSLRADIEVPRFAFALAFAFAFGSLALAFGFLALAFGSLALAFAAILAFADST